MSSQHFFDIDIATKYGVNVAIFLSNLAYWTEINMADNKNHYDGRFWSYKTQKAFTILFPYWTRQNLRTVINKCLDEKLVIIGNYNKNKYDQTKWYALTELGISLFSRLKEVISSIGENQPIDGLQSTNHVVDTHQPIPNIDTDIKPDNKKSEEKKPHPQLFPSDFKVNKEQRDICCENNLDIDMELREFKTYYSRKRKSDWEKDFTVWLLRSVKYARQNHKIHRKKESSLEMGVRLCL